jgi:hypothetical protein
MIIPPYLYIADNTEIGPVNITTSPLTATKAKEKIKHKNYPKFHIMQYLNNFNRF